MEPMDVDSPDRIEQGREYVPGNYEGAPRIPSDLLREVTIWNKDTYKCFDSRGEGNSTEFYVLLVQLHVEGWVHKSFMTNDTARVCAATVSRKVRAYERVHGVAGPSTPANVVTPATFVTPTRPGVYYEDELVKHHNTRSSAAKAAHTARTTQQQMTLPIHGTNIFQPTRCNEKLLPGEQHGGSTHRCGKAEAHLTEPHHHFRGRGEGEVLCEDDDCPVYEDYRFCDACHAAVYDELYTEADREEIDSAALRQVSVGALALCTNCGPERIRAAGLNPDVRKLSTCVCDCYAARTRICGPCRVAELRLAVRLRNLEIAERARLHGEPLANMTCVCGAWLAWGDRYWQCHCCNGFIVRSLPRESLAAAGAPILPVNQNF